MSFLASGRKHLQSEVCPHHAWTHRHAGLVSFPLRPEGKILVRGAADANDPGPELRPRQL